MRLLMCAALFCGVLAAQQRAQVIDRVAVGADDSGRAALCEELRRTPRRPEEVPILPEGSSLLCEGDTFALRLDDRPPDADAFICGLATKPSALVFYQMRPIALKRGSTVTLPQELSDRLQPSGVVNVGRLLSAFGFVELELKHGEPAVPFRSIGIHEIHLLCDG